MVETTINESNRVILQKLKDEWLIQYLNLNESDPHSQNAEHRMAWVAPRLHLHARAIP